MIDTEPHRQFHSLQIVGGSNFGMNALLCDGVREFFSMAQTNQVHHQIEPGRTARACKTISITFKQFRTGKNTWILLAKCIEVFPVDSAFVAIEQPSTSQYQRTGRCSAQPHPSSCKITQP